MKRYENVLVILIYAQPYTCMNCEQKGNKNYILNAINESRTKHGLARRNTHTQATLWHEKRDDINKIEFRVYLFYASNCPHCEN